MTMRRPRHPAAHVAALSGVTVLLVAVACEAPRPTAPTPRSEMPLTAITNTTPSVMSEDGVSEERIRDAIAAHLPELATRRGTPQRAWFVVDAEGKVVQALRGDEPPPGEIVGSFRTVEGHASTITGTVRILNDPLKSSENPPSPIGTLDAGTIRSIDVVNTLAGRVAPDPTSVVWIQLRAPGEKGNGGYRMSFKSTNRPTTVEGTRIDSMSFEAELRPTLRADTLVVGQPLYQPSRLRLLRDGDSSRTIEVNEMNGTSQRIGLRRPLMAAGTPEPLYLLDGRELPADQVEARIGAMRLRDIAKIEALNAEQAMARFGARARGGAIVVTSTKH